ncbi:hypothetical protein FC756_19330 [Lysinibacillus mangiferihumi]|uniref:Uncharacterized protein n=1 Tax=Lysinibacillus mangiferihumi TaxID=1130819 RepID=A0A4U2YN17_9BACI|nr:hypothetical protein [Lysinibacillus mangiferihumi]TKI62022.1 hypothetical protein FC756_19330 [Lysinibacillus mangiferihumi]
MSDSNKYIDVFGLISETSKGFHVYGLYEKGTSKPYYIVLQMNLREEQENIVNLADLIEDQE